MQKKFYLNTLPIACIFAFRMLGLFMLIPIFTIYADEYSGATSKLIGLALGAYGLTQAAFQIPLGSLSDRIGRKPVITLGLSLFILGSIIAAMTDNIYVLIGARALQGTGAIGSTLIALTADLTHDEDRTKGMALIGLTIGLSFAIAMIISPPIAKNFHLKGVFILMAILGMLGIILLYAIVPSPKKEIFHADSEVSPNLFKTILSNGELSRLNLGIFCQHAILTSTFFVIPMLIEHKLEHQWHFYLPILVISFVGMVPFILYAEKRYKMKQNFNLAIAFCLISQAILLFSHTNITSLASLLLIYFLGFNILEASLPSLVSKTSPAGSKGTAMGIYSASQYLGLFFGGFIAGTLFDDYSFRGIFLFNTVLAFAWLLVGLSMKQPNYYSSKIVPLNDKNLIDVHAIKKKILNIKGVKEVTVLANEKVAYLKIDKKIYLDHSVEAIL